MAIQASILFLGDDVWRLGARGGVDAPWRDLPAPAGGDVAAAAAQVAEALRVAGADSPRLALSLPAGWCCSARLQTPEDDDTKVGGRAWRTTRLYEFEEMLPLAAEDLIADFVPGATATLGVCTGFDRLAAIVAALEDAGVRIGPIAPFAVWVLESVADEAADALLVGENDTLNLILLEAGRPTAWHVVPADAADVRVRLELLAGPVRQTPFRVACVGVSEAVQLGLQSVATLTPLGDDADARAATAAETHLAEERRPMIDCRRDRLAAGDAMRDLRTPAVAAIAAAAVLMLALSAGLLVRASAYNSQADDLRAQQQRIYRHLMPDARDTPTDVARRLASQQLALAAQSGSPDGLTNAPSALVLLRDVFARLPDAEWYRITRLRIDGRGVELVGEVASHQQAGQITAALGQDGLFNVQPPRTTALREGGIGFTIGAALAGAGGGRR